MDLAPSSGRYLSFSEREDIAILRATGVSIREIARRLGRSPSTVSRELRRNAATRCGKLEYRASVAQWKSDLVAQRPKTPKLVVNDRLRDYVQERLSADVLDANGMVVGPPGPAWQGRNKPHRGDRRWVQGWSPEQISNRLRIDFPDDDSMRISHEAIYQALYIEGRGGLERQLVTCLRTGRALRVPRGRKRQKAWAHVTPESLLSERPVEVEDRAEAGHWEGDLIIGLKRSAIGTVVERTSRFTLLVHLPREEGFGVVPPTKNGAPLAGYGAKSMRRALVATMSALPEGLRRSLTWDRGKELSDHLAFIEEIGTPVFFADAQSPWQRGTNENTNGLLRNYFPKGTDLSRWNAEELLIVADTLQRAGSLARTNRCCVDRLNLDNTCRSATQNVSPRTVCWGPLDPEAIHMTTPWPNRSSVSTRPNWSATEGPGEDSTTSNWPPSSGSTGSTTSASSTNSDAFHRPNTKPTTTVRTSQTIRPRLKQPSLCKTRGGSDSRSGQS